MFKKANIVAALLLIFTAVAAITSMADDSLTMDEVAHLPAGYSYLTQKDMRLNPEHPPLIKDLAALPLLFMKEEITLPLQSQAWQDDINGQWSFGYDFLYQQNNPTDKMIFRARIVMVLVLILLGFYVFKWTKELFGEKAALLSLFLFCFSPTFLAHGRLVTTDVGAAAGIFIASYYFLKALKNPDHKNIILAGIAFGLAQLCKFSVVLLIPFFFIVALAFWMAGMDKAKTIMKNLILIMIIGFIVILPFYQYHVWNYPAARQYRDTEANLKDYPAFIQNIILWATDKPILRAYAQYATGVLMVLHRAAFGHTIYFMGEISSSGWKNYFPIVYIIKEPLVFHILTLISILYAAWSIKKPLWQNTKARLKSWVKEHFSEFAMLVFLIIYWASSLSSNLNLGVRHLLPIFPFIFVLIGGTIIKLLKEPHLKLKVMFLAFLLAYQVASVMSVYPHFLAYFNEIAGGPENGYIFTVDSNLDWGQDLKRLKQWLDENKIDEIYLDYFGGGDPSYYLKEKFNPWSGQQKEQGFPKGNYLAVSASPLQGGRGEPVPGFDQASGYYNWLNKYEPIEKIGYSIFIYYID